MARRVTTDTSELRAFAADMREIPARLERHIYDVVKRGAQNIKDEMRSEMGKSKHFGMVAPSIDYDITVRSAFGVGSYEAEIGPNKDVRVPSRKTKQRKSANEHEFKGTTASLAQFAYFGTATRPGTVQDPQVALDNEAPKFEAALGALLDGIL